MKKKAKRLLALMLSLIMFVSVLITPASAARNQGGATGSANLSDVGDVLNTKTYAEYKRDEDYVKAPKAEDTIVINGVDYSTNAKETDLDSVTKLDEYYGKNNVVQISGTGKVTWNFNVPKTGKYVLVIEYCQIAGKTNSIERILYINDEVPFSEARSLVLSKVWKYQYKTETLLPDGTKDYTFATDKTTGNDIRPSVKEDIKWQTYELSDSNGYYTDPFEFLFKEGENSITLESIRESVAIKSITLKPAEEKISYNQYLKEHGPAKDVNDVFFVEAEAPSNVSNVTMYPVNDRTSSITSGLNGEQSAEYTLLNTFGKEQWQTVGEWAEYEIAVENDGYYSIVVRYKQDLLSGMYVSRKLYIDGEVPFKEAENCRFDYTDDWKVTKLTDGNYEFKFYLTKGLHTLRLEAVLGDMAEQIQIVSDSLAKINNCYLEIIKLTGSDPDTNRTYNFSRVMPDVLRTMMQEAANLEGVYEYLTKPGKDGEEGIKGEKAATIEQIYILLRKMGSDEKQIPVNLQTLKTQIGSLGTWINSVKSQPLQLDYIQVQSPNAELPEDDAGFFASLWYELKLFWYSFFTDYNDVSGDSSGAKNGSVEVWVTTGTYAGRDEAQVIRNLAENKFTPDKEIGVNLKLVSGGTLLPSVLAGVGPDVALMESSTTIIDYALRNAVIPLNEFIEDDLKEGEDVLSWYPEAASVPLTLFNFNMNTAETTATYYALPDTLQFSMMFYRKDVLSSLGLEIPKTWDDLLSILPVLQYNNMEIGIQNDIYTFIYQSNNEVYADGGLRINFDDPGVLNAFTKLCNMYTQYSLPYTFDFANRFRTGEMPIGIANYSTCNQLSIFASELSGLWGFTVLPGYEHTDENGETYINNCAISTVTGCVMLKGCERKNQKNAWEFMKWYTSADFQVDYSNDIVSIKGIAARPSTANIEALAELPWTNEEAQEILAQFGNLEAVPNYPGSYYLARYINFAFLAAYNDGEDPANALLDYVNTINKEINRKREEFDSMKNNILPEGMTYAEWCKANNKLHLLEKYENSKK